MPVPSQLPASFELVTAELSDTTRFSRWPSDSAGAGYAVGDSVAARAAALGEAVERYCGNLVPDGLRRATRAELVASGTEAIDFTELALFSDRQYAAVDFPFHPLTDDLSLEWTTGTDLSTARPVAVPAGLVWVSYVATADPPTNPIIQAGLAAGIGRRHAEHAALYEVLERDAVALAWHGHGAIRLVQPPEWLAKIAHGRRNSLRSTFIEFDSPFSCVVGALVRDTETGYLTMGTACRDDPATALRKAFAEACQLQLFVASYDDPASGYMRAAERSSSPLQPWRSERDYRNAYRADLRDVVDYGCHLQLFLDPVLQERFERELAEAISTEVSYTDLASESVEPSTVLDRLTGAGHRVISVDVTTTDVASSGWSAVRVVVPGLYSNSAAGLPFLGGHRLADQLRTTGKSRRTLPLPH